MDGLASVPLIAKSVPGAGMTEITDQWSPPYSPIVFICRISLMCNSFLCQAVVFRSKTLESARSF